MTPPFENRSRRQTPGPPVEFLSFRFIPDPEALLARLGLASRPPEAGDFFALLEKAASVAVPRAAFVPVPAKEMDRVFHDAALVRRIGGGGLVFPYIATCGRELYAFGETRANPLERFWIEEIKQQALEQAHAAAAERIRAAYEPPFLGDMSPGAVAGWALEGQEALFALLGEGAELCGVTLNSSYVMLPNRSVSGIFFSCSHPWNRCAECSRENCGESRIADVTG